MGNVEEATSKIDTNEAKAQECIKRATKQCIKQKLGHNYLQRGVSNIAAKASVLLPFSYSNNFTSVEKSNSLK